MQTFRSVVAVALVLFLGLVTPAIADQRHAVDPSVMSKAVAEHTAAQRADRAAIREALERPQVQQVAKQIGVDLGRMSAAVGTMSGADLARAAAAARHVNQALSGGASTVVISTTTIIIALLVVILLIVALK
jgi:hypothetical protein